MSGLNIASVHLGAWRRADGSWAWLDHPSGVGYVATEAALYELGARLAAAAPPWGAVYLAWRGEHAAPAMPPEDSALSDECYQFGLGASASAIDDHWLREREPDFAAARRECEGMTEIVDRVMARLAELETPHAR